MSELIRGWILLGWFFALFAGQTALILGPFKTQLQCELWRKVILISVGVWYFLTISTITDVNQAGPFISKSECERVRKQLNMIALRVASSKGHDSPFAVFKLGASIGDCWRGR